MLRFLTHSQSTIFTITSLPSFIHSLIAFIQILLEDGVWYAAHLWACNTCKTSICCVHNPACSNCLLFSAEPQGKKKFFNMLCRSSMFVWSLYILETYLILNAYSQLFCLSVCVCVLRILDNWFSMLFTAVMWLWKVSWSVMQSCTVSGLEHAFV